MPQEAEKSIVTFDSIIRNEKFIFTDREVCLSRLNNWYGMIVNPSSSFSKLDCDNLSKTNNELNMYLSWLSHPRVYTTSLVVDELEYFKWRIHKKLISLNKHEKFIRKKERFSVYGGVKKKEKKLLEDICFCYVNITKIAKRKIFQPEYAEKFKMLEGIVLNLVDYLGTKKDVDRDEQIGDIHTDEQLVTAALYRSLVLKKPSCIVTIDRHIKRIVTVAEYFLTDQQMPANGFFSNLLEHCPIRSYYVTREGIKPYLGGVSFIRKYFHGRFHSVKIPDSIKDMAWQYMCSLSKKDL